MKRNVNFYGTGYISADKKTPWSKEAKFSADVSLSNYEVKRKDFGPAVSRSNLLITAYSFKARFFFRSLKFLFFNEPPKPSRSAGPRYFRPRPELPARP